MYGPLPTAAPVPGSPPPDGPSGPYSPIDTFQAAFTHLSTFWRGHLGVAGLWLVYIFVFVCAGMGIGFGAAILTAAQGEDAGPFAVLAFYGPIVGLSFLSAPLVQIFWCGYQAATLAEIRGGEPVGLSGVLRLGLAHVGVVLALMVVNCGMSFVGLLLCYVGIFVTMVPFRYAFLVAHDRGLGVSETLALTWTTFRERTGDHFLAFLGAMVVSLVCSAIPLVGPVLSLPLIVTFDAMTFRQFYPKDA